MASWWLAGGAVLLAQASAESDFATGVLPDRVIIGLGVGMVFAPVSVTAMAGTPPQNAGMESGFLMAGHEVGAALGVAVLSAVANSAGRLANATGMVDGFGRGFFAAAGIAAVLAVFAYLRIPAAPGRSRRGCTCTTDPNHGGWAAHLPPSPCSSSPRPRINWRRG